MGNREAPADAVGTLARRLTGVAVRHRVMVIVCIVQHRFRTGQRGAAWAEGRRQSLHRESDDRQQCQYACVSPQHEPSVWVVPPSVNNTGRACKIRVPGWVILTPGRRQRGPGPACAGRLPGCHRPGEPAIATTRVRPDRCPGECSNAHPGSPAHAGGNPGCACPSPLVTVRVSA